MSYTFRENTIVYPAYSNYGIDDQGQFEVYGSPSDEVIFDWNKKTIKYHGKKYKAFGEALIKAAYQYYLDTSGNSYSGIVANIDHYEVDNEGYIRTITVQVYETHTDHISTLNWYDIDPVTLRGDDLFGDSINLNSYF